MISTSNSEVTFFLLKKKTKTTDLIRKIVSHIAYNIGSTKMTILKKTTHPGLQHIRSPMTPKTTMINPTSQFPRTDTTQKPKPIIVTKSRRPTTHRTSSTIPTRHRQSVRVYLTVTEFAHSLTRNAQMLKCTSATQTPKSLNIA